jgi:hypothetical protein
MELKISAEKIERKAMFLRERIGSFDETPIGKIIIDQPIPPTCIIFQLENGDRYKINFDDIAEQLIATLDTTQKE